MGLEIKVDVIGQLTNTRQSFADPLCFVDELVQNAQRAGASRVTFEVTDTEVKYADNGCGCEDLQMVFTQSLSGWSDEVKAAENPFGFGFFACIVVADEIVVRSRCTEAIFDVALLFREKRTDVVTANVLPKPVKGFEVVLWKLRDITRDRVCARVRQLARYVKPDVLLNGERCEQESMVKKNADEEAIAFSRVCKSESFTGVLYPTTYGPVRTFLSGREVAHVYTSGIGGRIEVKAGKLDPRCPDRKAWIENTKFWNFHAELRKYAAKVLTDVVRYGTDDQIDQFAAPIDYVLKQDVWEKHLTFDVQAGNKVADAIAGASEEKLKAAKSVQELLKSLDYMPENPEDAVLADTPPPNSDAHQQQLFTISTAGLAAPPPEITLVRTESGKLRVVPPPREGVNLSELKRRPVVFYVLKAEALTHVALIREARYYGAEILVLSNKLHVKAVSGLKNCYPITAFRATTRNVAKLTERGPMTAAEQRAEQLLNLMARAAGVEGQIVEIGNAEFATEYLANGVPTGKTTASNHETLAATDGHRIYVQRTRLDVSRLANRLPEDALNEADRAFMLRQLLVMSHELAHYLTGVPDGDVALYEAQLKVQQRIIEALF